MSKLSLNTLIAVWVLMVALTGPAAAKTIYVDPNGSADFNSIQAAIDDPCTVDNDEIEVASGTYNEAIDFLGKAVRLYSSGGPEVTTIDGTGNYHVVQCVSGEDANTILEGFTITGGKATGVGPDSLGGGIVCYLSSPTIVDCNVTGNEAGYGGGIYGLSSNLAIIGCKINNNVATINGGGLHFYWFYPVVINCEIRKNIAQKGGGMVSDHSQPTITNSTFSENAATAGQSGALFSLPESDEITPWITNCIFWGDSPGEIVCSTWPHNMPVVQFCDVQGGGWVFCEHQYFTGRRQYNAKAEVHINVCTGAWPIWPKNLGLPRVTK